MALKRCMVSGMITVAALLLFGGSANAAQTGKIAGRVTDQASGEPIPGAAVMIVGSRVGASTDVDGRYFIINLPPGEYSVEASLVGYRSATLTGLRVNVDRTAQANFALASTTIEVGGVTVVAPREVIQLDVSGSKTILEPSEVTAVPTKSVQEALALEPGVGVTGGIRGGGLDQTQVIVDGRLAVDERLNVPKMTVVASSLQELQVLTGGFNAEYGNARSGVINVVSRPGLGQPIWGGFTGQYYPAHKKFYEPDGYAAFGENSFEWQKYGKDVTTTLDIQVPDPTPSNPNNMKWQNVFAGWTAIAANPAQNPKGLSANDLLEKWRWQHRVKDYANTADYVVDGAVGIPIGRQYGLVIGTRMEQTAYATPQINPAYKDFQLDVKLNFRPIEPLRLNLGVMVGQETGMGASGRGLTSTIYRDFGASINFLGPTAKYALYGNTKAAFDRMAISLTGTYTLNQAAYVDAGLEYNQYGYNISAGERATPAALILTSGLKDTLDSVPYGWIGTGRNDGTWMNYELAGQANSRDSSDWHSIRLFGTYTNQLNSRNLLRAGVEGVFVTLNQKGGVASAQNYQMQKWTATPTRLAAFVQDKIEHEGMIANLGLRMDYYNSNGEILEPWQYPGNLYTNIYDHSAWGSLLTDWDMAASIKKRFGPNGTVAPDSLQTEDVSAKIHFSPRLGISHPISRTTKVFFNYGHFYAVPQNQYVFGMYPNQPGSIEYLGNPDLDMPRTIAYELGFDQELFGVYLLHVAGYYKDATNEINLTIRKALAPTQPYDVIEPFNKQYSDIRGFEFKLSKRIGRFTTGFWSGGVEMVTTTRLGYARISEDVNEVPVAEFRDAPYRARPYSKLNLDLHTPRDFSLMGLPALATGGWSLNWLTSYQRGADAIYDPVSAPGTLLSQAYVKSPNVSYPDWWMSDMRIQKGFTFGKVNCAAFFDVNNVFARKVWTGSMRGDDLTAYMKSLHFPIDDPLIEDTRGNDKIGDTPSYAVLPIRDQWTLFSYPRTFSFGVRVDF